ncbi:MAG TPA: hypothetical protein DEF00_04765, partial [Candidatus Taylorbacteria bacterium]
MGQTLTDNIFYTAISGFVAGIFVRSFLEIGIAFSLLFIFLGGIFCFLFILRGYMPRIALLSGLFLFAAGLGMARFDIADKNATRSGLEAYVGKTLTLQGIIADEPDVREGVTRLILRVDLPLGAAKALLTVPHEPVFRYGDRVSAEGKLERPRNFTDEETGREVDYVSHLAKDGIR